MSCTTRAARGTRRLLALLFVATGWFACGGDASGSLAFRDMRVEEVSSTRAVLRFETSAPTSCEAQYGATEALGLTATDPDMQEGETRTEHEVALEDLTPRTRYYVRAVVTDDEGRTHDSRMLSFQTPPSSQPTPQGENVALLSAGASVIESSSNYGGAQPGQPFHADRAFDGSMSSEWSSDGDGDGAFVEIDLGQTRTLVGFGFRSRQMSDGSSIIRKLRLTLDGVATLGPYDTPDPDVHYSFSLEPITARRVRVDAVETSGGNTGAKEIELFEEPVATGSTSAQQTPAAW